MNVSHFFADLRIAINPDNILAIGYPIFGGFYHFSAPSFWDVVMTSPPCRAGSNWVRRSSRVNGGLGTGAIITDPSITERRTR